MMTPTTRAHRIRLWADQQIDIAHQRGRAWRNAVRAGKCYNCLRQRAEPDRCGLCHDCDKATKKEVRRAGGRTA